MKINALVMEDEVRSYIPKGGDKPVFRRTLHLVDRDEDCRLLAMVKLGISMDDPVAGPSSQGASLRDCQVSASISRIQQFDWDKSLGFEGKLLKVTRPGKA